MTKGPRPTVEELVSTLRRSSLPTVVTEGEDDYLTFRRMEERLAKYGVSFLPAGGRPAVTALFERRSEFAQIKAAFVMDRDLWSLADTPPAYRNLPAILTDGYSIENDLFRDGDLSKYLTARESVGFNRDLGQCVAWFAHGASLILTGQGSRLDVHPNELLDANGRMMPAFSAEVARAPADPRVHAAVLTDPRRLLRGKTLFSLLVKYLSAPTRQAKYSKHTLMDVASASNGPHLARIEQEIVAVMA